MCFDEQVGDSGDVLLSSLDGQVIRTPLNTVPILTRKTRGSTLMRMKQPGDRVSNVALINAETHDNDSNEE